MTLEQRALELVFTNPHNRRIAEMLPRLGVPDAWLVSGCVFQAVWNGLSGRDPQYGILDYDVFYFDPDLSYEAEDAIIQRCAAAFADLGVDVQVRNQARVHLWYPQKFGRPYPALVSTAEALTRFLAPACAVGVRISGGVRQALAPFGWDDVFARRIQRNPAVTGSSAEYDAKAARWKAKWPEIDVAPWDAISP
jgi:uncharacterized protein